MKHFILGIAILTIAFQSVAQNIDLFNQYNRELNTHSRNGMIALGSWSIDYEARVYDV
ncbi:hypothetical protein OAE93_00095 [bacterium]|nr:hypothetical protein [bacterium]